MPHGRSTSCYARSTPSVYTTCLACVRLADHTSRARRIRAHRRTVSTRSLRQRIRSTESGHGSEATGTSAATDTASRRRAHIRTRRPGAGGRRAPGSRRRKWRAGCAGPGRARGSRLGVRLRVGSPDSARGGTARTTTPHTRENRESRRRLADLEMSRGIRKSAKAMMLAVSCRRRTRTHINGNFD